VEARFSAPVQTGPGAHPSSCTVGTGSFPGVQSGRCVTPISHPLLVPRSKNRVGLYLYSPERPSWPGKRVKPNPTSFVLVYTGLSEKGRYKSYIAMICHAGNVTKSLSYDCCRLVNLCPSCNLRLLHKINLTAV
jgi:hypothetical protein